MSKSIDWSKPIRCKDGRPARVLATDLKGDWSIAVAIERYESPCTDVGSGEYTNSCLPDGRLSHESTQPFFENIPERFEYVRWLNVYEGGPGEVLYESEDKARRLANLGLVSTVPVTISGERE